MGRDARMYLLKSETISERVLQVLEENLQDAVKSEIARIWARKLGSDIEYAFAVLTAFQKGLTLEV